jgi:hypothetical protein
LLRSARNDDARNPSRDAIRARAKSLARLKENRAVWREPKPGAQEIWQKYLELREKYKKDDGPIEDALQNWYRDLPKSHPSKALSRYRHVDKHVLGAIEIFRGPAEADRDTTSPIQKLEGLVRFLIPVGDFRLQKRCSVKLQWDWSSFARPRVIHLPKSTLETYFR